MPDAKRRSESSRSEMRMDEIAASLGLQVNALKKQISDLEAIVRQYRRISSAAGDKAWKDYQKNYDERR